MCQLFENLMNRHLHPADCCKRNQQYIRAVTFEINDAFLRSLHLDALVGRLVALQLRIAGGPVADESLLALQHEYRTIDEVEIVFAILVDRVGGGVEVTRSLRHDVTAVVRAERQRTVTLPDQIEQGVGRPTNQRS